MEEWTEAMQRRDIATITSQMNSGPKTFVNRAMAANVRLNAILHKATEAAKELIAGLLTREEALHLIDHAYETLNGTVYVFYVHGNFTKGEEWMNDRDTVTSVSPGARRWWDMAANDFLEGIKRLVNVNKKWQGIIDNLRQTKEKDKDVQKEVAYDFVAAADVYATTFMSGITFALSEVLKEWSHEKQ